MSATQSPPTVHSPASGTRTAIFTSRRCQMGNGVQLESQSTPVANSESWMTTPRDITSHAMLSLRQTPSSSLMHELALNHRFRPQYWRSTTHALATPCRRLGAMSRESRTFAPRPANLKPPQKLVPKHHAPCRVQPTMQSRTLQMSHKSVEANHVNCRLDQTL